MNQLWSWLLGAVGLAGFVLVGRRVWWAWYINIANQFIWLAYSLVTRQLGFLITSIFFLGVFVNNARMWTKERNNERVLQSD